MDICAAGFRLGNTLSENGGVTRGICTMDEEGRLVGIDETKNIVKTKDGAVIRTDAGDVPVDPDRKVSMNMWGFEAGFIDTLEEGFRNFLANIEEGDIKSEYLLPIYIDQLIKENRAEVKVLPTNETWFGVTFQEDKAAVIEAFAKLVKDGVYKENLYA